MSDLLQDLLPLVWTGIVTGCLYAMGALGLVMIFKATRVVNFAHGNLAALAGFVVYGLTQAGGGIGWIAAVLIALAIVVLLALVAYGLIARVSEASDLRGTIATLGISLVLQGVVQVVFGADIVNLDLPVPNWSATVAGLRVTSYDITVLAVSGIVIAALFLVIERTRVGIAFRAVSTSAFASRVCGLNIHAVQGLAWGVAAGLGVTAALLIIPSTFLSSTTVASFMLQSFAAAVLGGFSSLPGSIVGGLIVGVTMNLFSYFVTSELSATFLLVLMLVALNLFPGGILPQRGGGSRA
ncbi:branched-chain amino acid ABC transporter permease [Pararoseomonas indoligenes]|uniref:Branched-chain amino acid ABC transporter permease n=1 Tax=Roseomonas indoligenes TaxID=2820811 RepID=A0A940N3S5_9PROT|nr:branched-chain amino acid ABC transporter permease [Pararoseomonas indoligenes]MBP0496059.1 branched-chain amino acid ABC transporter permease [Pararoseomonas indoligenes]